MTPNLAAQRAIPGAGQVKRKLELSPITPSGTPTRPKNDLEWASEDSRMEQQQVEPFPTTERKPTVLERLMNQKVHSLPTPRRRHKSRIRANSTPNRRGVDGLRQAKLEEVLPPSKKEVKHE